MKRPLTDRELTEIVGKDLFALIRSHLPPVIGATPVSPLTSPTWSRTSFRLALEDGSSMKGHQLETAAAAERAVLLGQLLPAGPFPRIVAHRNRALLSEWIDGVALSERPAGRDELKIAGAIQRSVHDVILPREIPDATDVYPGPSWRHELAARVESLCQHHWLSRAEGDRVIALAKADMPRPRPVRLAHGDICPENIVADREGRLHVIDNVGIDLHTAEFDLARTRYRWPMSDEARAAFDDGYGDSKVLASLNRHLIHWTVVVLVGAAEFRCRWQLPGSEGPIGQLRDLLASGKSPPRSGSWRRTKRS